MNALLNVRYDVVLTGIGYLVILHKMLVNRVGAEFRQSSVLLKLSSFLIVDSRLVICQWYVFL